MPIRSDLLPLYRTPEYIEARARLRRRAGGSFDPAGRYLGGARCEQCGVEDRKTALRACGWWTPATLEATVHMMPGGRFTDRPPTPCTQLPWSCITVKNMIAGFPREICRWVGIVLTTAHLDHDPANNADDNLKLLCQWCHLNYDGPHHKYSRSVRKDRGRPLLSL
jgi:hypothetical protein